MVYIDEEYKCHVTAADGRRAVEASFFDGKCREFIEGYRFIPSGEIWELSGAEYLGEMAFPWGEWGEMQTAQRAYTDGIDSMDGTIAALMDEIENLCNELIGE